MPEAPSSPTLLADPGSTSSADTVAHRLVGTWTTVLDNDGTPTPGLSTFFADGNVILTQINAKSIGLGSWTATGPTSFTYRVDILAADESGGFKGTAVVQVSGSFDSETSWAGEGGATFHDASGTPLRSHGGSTVTATRVPRPPKR